MVPVVGEGSEETVMIRYECGICPMVATCVATPSADLAWQDHMNIHANKRSYRAWTWAVVPLELL